MQRLLLWIFCVGLLYACTSEANEIPPSQHAYVPIYGQLEKIHEVKWVPARKFKNPGKQYVYGSWLLQNEVNEGIHIIDISHPGTPEKKGFLAIPLCTELAVKQGMLYTNNFDDLLVIDLRNINLPRVVKRIEKVFTPPNQQYPPFFNTAFVCPDPAKGVVTGWELKNAVKADCRR